MDRVEVTELSGRPFDELSGGEQRRVTIARVLCQDAPVVLLDEPTDSLDLGHAELVMAVAADQARRGKTVVTTSHDLNVAARHATKMVLLSHGRTVKVGTPSEVLEPGILSEVYATTVTVIEHPASGLPVVVV
jgi:iron complex transport system ATP-binding protein